MDKKPYEIKSIPSYHNANNYANRIRWDKVTNVFKKVKDRVKPIGNNKALWEQRDYKIYN